MLSGKVRSGGSAKNWDTIIEGGTRLRIKDVPRPIAERAGWTIIAPNAPETIAKIAAIDRESLTAERGRLVARIAEIDDLLSG